MYAKNQDRKPSLLKSVVTNRCPHCREGRLFLDANPYHLRSTMSMPEKCPVCGQPFELHPGFYYGTGYVSYGLSVLITAITFVGWWFTAGMSASDNRVYWWLGFNTAVLILTQPMMQRLSRSIWIAMFVRYRQPSTEQA